MAQLEIIRGLLGNRFACIIVGTALVYGIYLYVHAHTLRLFGRKHKQGKRTSEQKEETGETEINERSAQEDRPHSGIPFLVREADPISIREAILQAAKQVKEPDAIDEKNRESLHDAVDSLIETAESLSASAERRSEQIERLEEQFDCFTGEFEGTTSCHGELTVKQNEEIDRLETKIAGLKRERKGCLKDKKKIFSKVRSLYMRKSRFRTWLARCTLKLKKCLAAYNRNASKLQKRIITCIEDKRALVMEYTQAAENKILMNDKTGNKSVKKKLTAYRKKCAQLDTYIKRYTKEVSHVKKRIDAMRKKHAARRKKKMGNLNTMVSENVRLRNLLSECLLEKEINLIEDEDTGLSEQIEEYRERSADLREQIMSLEVENESLKTELSRQCSQDPCDDEANPVMKTLYRENKELNRKVNEYRAEIDSMQLQLEECTAAKSREKKTGPPLFSEQARSMEHDPPGLSQDGSPENSGNGLILPDRPSPGENGTLYNVFLPKLTSEEKKDKAVHLISEITGISEEEAALLSNKVVIPVVRGVKKNEADSIKTRFIEAGILPRVKRQV